MSGRSADGAGSPRALGRRRFLKGAAAAAATFHVVAPSSVRGSEANSRVTVGCIGFGGRGRLIAGMLAGHAGFEVTAVADYFPDVARAAGERLKVAGARRFSGLSGYRKLIASKVDAVFLETPPCFFPEHAAAAVAAGCHVYVAKPVAVDVPGCVRIGELGRQATKAKRVFLVDFQTRTHPLFIEAIRRVHAGGLGKIGLIWSDYTDNGFRDPPLGKTIEGRLRGLTWVNDVALGGGNLVAAGVHAVDVALWVAGRAPVRAAGCSRASRAKPHGDTHDVYSITYELPDGAIWTHRGEHVANVYGFTCTCRAFGHGAYFEGSYDGRTFVRGGKQPYKGGTVENLYRAGIEANLNAFHKSVTAGVYDNPTVEPSVRSTLACILGRDAARANGQLTWQDMMKANRRIEADLTGLKA